MGNREQLHELRQQAHDAGIEGNSKMTEEQLREALRKVGKGERPQAAKQEAKRQRDMGAAGTLSPDLAHLVRAVDGVESGVEFGG